MGGDSWGWRLALGFAFVPSFFLFIGGTFLPDSPNSLLERGYPEKARLLSLRCMLSGLHAL